MTHLTIIEGGLSKTHRTRRRTLPDLSELRGMLHKPSKRTICVAGFDVEVLREPFTPMLDEPRDEDVCRRETLCVVAHQGVEIGCLHFVEFQPPSLCLNVQFWDALDSYSMEDSQLARTLLEGWEYIGTDVADYGNIVELRVVATWRNEHQAWRLVDPLVTKLFPRHSLLVVQATPLNPRDTRGVDDAHLDVLQARQRAALMRVCERRLKFTAFPSQEAAEDGWMWRTRADLSEVIRAPASSPIRPQSWLS